MIDTLNKLKVYYTSNAKHNCFLVGRLIERLTAIESRTEVQQSFLDELCIEHCKLK